MVKRIYGDRPELIGWMILMFAFFLSVVSSCDEIYADLPETVISLENKI